MTKIDIFSGFLGAGKTTLIRKLIAEGYKNEKLVLIENEFGEIAIDGGFLKDAGVQITEMNSGCICCTLVGDFTKALKKVMEEYAPDRIIIEPSGVGKLSDVAHAVEQVEGAHIGAKVTVVDAGKCRMYMRNFGEFFNDQVENADLIVMSRTDTASAEKILAATELLNQLNAKARLISTPWDKLSGEQIVEAMEHNALHEELEHMEHEHHHEHEHDHEHHHHDHDEHDEHCTCGCHDHDHDDDEHEHHHDHDTKSMSTSMTSTAPAAAMITSMTMTMSITIIITPTRCSRAGAWRPRVSSPSPRCAASFPHLRTRPSTALFSARRALSMLRTAIGSTSTTSPARSISAAAALQSPAASA